MICTGRQVLRDFSTQWADFSRKECEINAFLGGCCMCDITYIRWLCHMTHSYMYALRDMTYSFTYIWCMCHMTYSHTYAVCVTWLIHVCEMADSYVTLAVGDVFFYDDSVTHTWAVYAKRFIHMWDVTHLYVRRDSLICATWLIDIWNMTHWYVRHDSSICATW